MNWHVMKFDDAVEDISGGNIKTPQKEYLSSGKYPIVDQGKELIGGYSDNKNILFHNKLPVIIFGDHTQCFKYIDFPFGMGADGVKILKPKIDIDTKYLYYYLKSRQFPTSGYDRHFKYLKRMEIKFPPKKNDQEKIVNVLDKVNDLIEKRRQSLAKLDQLAQSIFLDMFGDPITNPKAWPIKFLDELSSKITDGTHETYETLNTGIKFITGKNIRPFRLDLSNLEYVSKENHREIYARCNPEYGDVLFTNIGAGVGTAVFNCLTEEFSMKNVALIKPEREIANGRYIESLLNIPYYKQFILDSNQQGGAQKFLSLKQIRTQKVIAPPIKLQDRFLYRVEKLYSLKEKTEMALTRLQTLQLSLSQKFFGENT